jgi:hypothetical protein
MAESSAQPYIRRLAVAFMRRTPTDRLHIAERLGVHEDLPERSDKFSVEILTRVRTTGQISALAALLAPHSCNTWPYPSSDLDIAMPEDNAKVHVARACCVESQPETAYASVAGTDGNDHSRPAGGDS